MPKKCQPVSAKTKMTTTLGCSRALTQPGETPFDGAIARISSVLQLSVPVYVLPLLASRRPGSYPPEEEGTTRKEEDRRMNERWFHVLTDERGSQVTEFGIYAALVVAGAIVLLSPIGKAVVGAYQQISAAL